MPAPYPFGLSTVIATSKSRSQPAAFRVSEPRRGFAYFQASGTDTPVFWDVVFRFKKCDAINFMLWFTQDLQRGVLDFFMDIRTEFGLLTHTCRFMPDALMDTREYADVFEYRAQIVARAQLIPADALTEWAGEFSGPLPDQPMNVGVPFSLALAPYFTGGLGPFTYGIASGVLPPGLSINASTGVVSGTPTGSVATFPDVVFYREGLYCIRKFTTGADFSTTNTPAFIGVASVGGGGTTALPAHEAGDLLIMITKRTGSTPTTTFAGTTPTNGTWGAPSPSTQKYRLEWKFDVSGTITTIGADVGNVSVCLIYRGATFGNVAVATTSLTNNVTAPALTASGAGSLMLEIFADSLNEFTSHTGTSVVRYNQNIALGGGDVVVLSTTALVTSAPLTQATFNASGFLSGVAFELLPIA